MIKRVMQVATCIIDEFNRLEIFSNYELNDGSSCEKNVIILVASWILIWMGIWCGCLAANSSCKYVIYCLNSCPPLHELSAQLLLQILYAFNFYLNSYHLLHEFSKCTLLFLKIFTIFSLYFIDTCMPHMHATSLNIIWSNFNHLILVLRGMGYFIYPEISTLWKFLEKINVIFKLHIYPIKWLFQHIMIALCK